MKSRNLTWADSANDILLLLYIQNVVVVQQSVYPLHDRQPFLRKTCSTQLASQKPIYK